jgi:hypothetical protein
MVQMCEGIINEMKILRSFLKRAVPLTHGQQESVSQGHGLLLEFRLGVFAIIHFLYCVFPPKPFPLLWLHHFPGRVPTYSFNCATLLMEKKKGGGGFRSTFNNFGLNERVHGSVS